MPSRMILNTGSVVGYNNQLRQAGPGMKLGVNNDVNQGTKKSALHLMGGRPSKINSPNSHPSNPTHKDAKSESVPVSRPKSQPKPAVSRRGVGAEPHGREKTAAERTPPNVSRKRVSRCEQNSRGGWGCGNRGVGLSSAALIVSPNRASTILFYISLHHKGDHSHNQQQGVLGQKPNGLAGHFKNERNNRAEQARQE